MGRTEFNLIKFTAGPVKLNCEIRYDINLGAHHSCGVREVWLWRPVVMSNFIARVVIPSGSVPLFSLFSDWYSKDELSDIRASYESIVVLVYSYSLCCGERVEPNDDH